MRVRRQFGKVDFGGGKVGRLIHGYGLETKRGIQIRIQKTLSVETLVHLGIAQFQLYGFLPSQRSVSGLQNHRCRQGIAGSNTMIEARHAVKLTCQQGQRLGRFIQK